MQKGRRNGYTHVLDGVSDSHYVPNASYLHSSSPYQAGNAKV